MDNSIIPSSHLPENENRPEYCSYCGAHLENGYYFCLSCATPYKNVESVLSRMRPYSPTSGVLIAKKAPHVAPLFWTYLAVILTAAVINFIFFKDSRPDLGLILQSALLFVTTCIFTVLYWPSLVVQFKRFGFLKPAALVGILALVPLLAINYFYHGWLAHRLGYDPTFMTDELRKAGLGTSGLIIFFCIFPAIVEEIAFRGLIQHWLHVAIPPFRAMVLASALFTALHFSILSAPYLFAVGMVLGWVKWKTASLYPSMLIHFLHNLIVIQFLWN